MICNRNYVSTAPPYLFEVFVLSVLSAPADPVFRLLYFPATSLSEHPSCSHEEKSSIPALAEDVLFRVAPQLLSALRQSGAADPCEDLNQPVSPVAYCCSRELIVERKAAIRDVPCPMGGEAVPDEVAVR